MTGVTRRGPGVASRAIDLGGHDRRVVRTGHGAMAPRAADGDPVGGIALLGDLDRVQAPAGDGHGDAAALVDRARGAQPVGALLDEPLGARRAAGLLVGGAREQHVTAQPRDRVAGRIQAGGARLGPRAGGPPRSRGRPCPSCRRPRARRRSRRRGRRRTGRASSARAARRRRRGARAAGTDRRRSRHRGAGRGPSRDPGPARRSRAARPASRRSVGDVPGGDELAVGHLGRRWVDRSDPDQVPEGVDQPIVRSLPRSPSSTSPEGAVGPGRHAAPARTTLRTTPMMNPPRTSPATMASSRRP